MNTKKSRLLSFPDERGNSLIQVVIASGLVMIVGLAISSTIVNLNKEVKALTEKILIKEVETQIKSLILNGDFCSCLLRNKTFDTTAGSEAIVNADQITQLPSGFSTGPLDASPCTVNSETIVPTVGTSLPGSTISVESIGLTNMQIVSPANYKADIEVKFSNTVRSIRGIKAGLQFSIDPAVNAITNRPFLACTNFGGGGGGGGSGSSNAAQLGLNSTFWPSYIKCAAVNDLIILLTVSIVNPFDGDVYYNSPYNTGVPIWMRFNSDGSYDTGNGASSCLPGISIQALKTANRAW